MAHTTTGAPTRHAIYEGTGQTVPATESRTHHLPLKGRQIQSEQFEFWHLPTRWQYRADRDCWIPDLGAAWYKPGANGVRAAGHDESARSVTGMRAGMAAKGGVLIDRTDPRIGGDYVRRHMTREGRWHHTDQWTSFTVLGNRLRTHHDMDGYIEWLQHLLTLDILGAMPVEVLEDRVEMLQRRIREYERIGGDRAEARIVEAEAQIEAMRAAWERQFGEAAVPHIVAPAAAVEAPKPGATVEAKAPGTKKRTRKPRAKKPADG